MKDGAEQDQRGAVHQQFAVEGGKTVTSTRVRTLLVEDDPAVCAIHHGFLLAHGGFEVVGQAVDGADALAKVVALEPDLVLLDIHLPDISGVEVLRRFRGGIAPDVDVLAVTAAQEVDTVRSAIAGGVVGYLVKPFTMAALHERLDFYLEARAPSGRSMLDQKQIDRMIGSSTGGRAPAEMPKGLSAETLATVWRALLEAGEESAAGIATTAGISRGSARRYLEHLVDAGRASRHPRYGSAGRPVVDYRAARRR